MKLAYVIHLAPLDERQQQAGQGHTQKRTRAKLPEPLAVSVMIASAIFIMSRQTVGVADHVVKQVHESRAAYFAAKRNEFAPTWPGARPQPRKYCLLAEDVRDISSALNRLAS